MKRRSCSTAAVAAAATVALLGLSPTASAVPVQSGQAALSGFTQAGSEESLRAFGLTRDQRLVKFRTDDRSASKVLGHIDGLRVDDRIVGIDIRPATGQLYGLGDAGGVYTIGKRSAQATRVSQLSVALEGARFGVDFNPTVDLLRIISDTGQNLRHDIKTPTGPTTVDGTLTYPASTTDPAFTATGVTAAAYTNNDTSLDSGTTLYNIDTNLDQVVIQAPANAGLLSATGKLTADVGGNAGFDIYSTVVDDKATELHAYAVLRIDGRFGLYDVRLSNGEVTRAFNFPNAQQVTDLALPLNQL